MQFPSDFINKVICGDSLEVMKGIPDNSVDLVLTDIPYDIVNKGSMGGLRVFDKKDANTVNFDLIELLNIIVKLVSKTTIIFCGATQYSKIEQHFIDNNISRRCLIWEKTNPSPANGEYLYLSGIELAVFSRKIKSTFNAHCKNTVFKYPNGSSKYHPTEKPLDLMKELIADNSNPNDLILDPFLGSGTTAVACKQLGRRYIGIEISQKYCNIAEDRLRQEELFR